MSGRRRFGALRRLSSGRWQARFRDPETGLYRNAPNTFATKTAAAKWLSAIETDIARGDWHDPKRGDTLEAPLEVGEPQAYVSQFALQATR